jgi:histone acetyltransferase (RNA polymerase elongator complex component)
MSLRHFTIPVFIPMEACPFRCIYCDQEKISGRTNIPSPSDVVASIEQHLKTIPTENSIVEVGFFGGTFTGLKMEIQERYLAAVQRFIREGKIQSIRLSTRPDFLDQPNIDLLRIFHVTTIELGAQSMDDEVLKLSGRGHTAADVAAASELIIANGLRLGLQMMVGLPGDSAKKSRFTANRFIQLGASDVRIYPTVVIKGTHLEKLFLAGKYIPLTLEEAISRVAEVLEIFEENDVNVIRVGLHPSEGILSGESLVAGPFHVSFRELVNTEIWGKLLMNILANTDATTIEITVPAKELNFAIGHQSKNRNMLLGKFSGVMFKTSESLKNHIFHVDYR